MSEINEHLNTIQFWGVRLINEIERVCKRDDVVELDFNDVTSIVAYGKLKESLKTLGKEHRRYRFNSVEEVGRKYPLIVAHIICTSLGYACPSVAAGILKDAIEGKENWCEWIYSCYGRKPMEAVKDSYRFRKGHRGYMADFGHAKQLVFEWLKTNKESLFASWF